MFDLKTSDRIEVLKNKMLDAPRYASIEQARIITRIYQENETLSIPKKRALSLKAALEELENCLSSFVTAEQVIAANELYKL